MARRGIVRAAERVAVWHHAADMWPTGPNNEMEDHSTSEVVPPQGTTQKPAPNSNKFKTPANGLKKALEPLHSPHDWEAGGGQPHSHPLVKDWATNIQPGFAKTYFKPEYQDALKSHLGEENYEKLKYHMPQEHHDALHTHQQAAPPKSNKFTTPANGLKKLLETPHTETAHVSDWLAKHPGFQKTYMSPKYQDALKGHLGDKAYNELQEHLKAAQQPAQPQHRPSADEWEQFTNESLSGGKSQNELSASPPKKPTKKWVGEGPEPSTIKPEPNQAHLETILDHLYNAGSDIEDPAIHKWLDSLSPDEAAHFAQHPKGAIDNFKPQDYDLEPADLGYGDEAYTSDDDPTKGWPTKTVDYNGQTYQVHPKTDQVVDEFGKMMGMTPGPNWKTHDPDELKEQLQNWVDKLPNHYSDKTQDLKDLIDKHWPEEQQPSFGEQLNSVIPGMHPGNWDALHQKDAPKAAQALQKAIATHSYEPDKVDALQKIYDKHFGDQDEINQIKSQQPPKSFGHAVQEMFPDLFKDHQVEAVNQKTPEQQKKMVQNTIDSKPEHWDKLNKLHNDFFGEDAYNTSAAKKELVEQMEDNHGDNPNYMDWINDLDKDDLEYFKQKPNAAKDAFDEHMGMYEDPDDYDEHEDDEGYNDGPEFDDDEDEDNEPLYNAHGLTQDYKKAFPNSTFTYNNFATPEQAKQVLKGIIDEPEDEGLGDNATAISTPPPKSTKSTTTSGCKASSRLSSSTTSTWRWR